MVARRECSEFFKRRKGMALVKLERTDYVTETPRYPDYPYAEWERRINRAKELMHENEVDAIVVWKRENVRYFFGFQTTQWEFPSLQPGVGIIPTEGEPTLIVPSLLLISAQAYCWTRNIWFQFQEYDTDHQRELPSQIANIIDQMGYGKKNIALEMGYLGHMWIPRPLNDIEAFKNALPHAKFVDGDRVIWGCRMIKSPLEIERIRQAVRVTAQCHAAIVEQFRPGMSEMDIGKIIHQVEVESGDFRGGDTSTAASFACNLEKEGIAEILAEDDVPITKNDYIKVDLQHRHKGYWGDIARCFQVSPATGEAKNCYQLCEEGMRNGEALIRSGVPAKEVYKGAVKPIIDAGLQTLPGAGHGIGMDVHEPPMLTANNEMILQEGMVLALEVWVHGSLKRKGGTGVFAIEDQYVVKDKGYEKIPGFDTSIIQVAHPFS
jgi:Xaa-Pro aminopeptidase